MGRYRGIGMPKAKKKKVPVVEVVEEMPAEEPPAPEPPDPPSTPPKKLVVVQPQSPSQTILLKAQHQARNFVKKATKHVHTNLERVNALFEAESRLYGAKIKALERAEKRKPKPSPVGQLQKAHRAELAFQRAYHNHTAAKYDASLDLVAVCEREIAAKDAKVRRLMRQLRVAKRAKRLRRGWSTTRVRFSL